MSADGSTLIYSTFLGGSAADGGQAIAVDSAGNAYVTGFTDSADFPTTPGSFQPTGTSGCFVTKLNPVGSQLSYSTYLNGGNCVALALDMSGNAYVTGSTGSTSFPTANPLQGTLHGQENAILAKLNPAGSALVFSTYLGGSRADFANGIGLDPLNDVYLVGGTQSSDFPTTTGAFQTTVPNNNNSHAFVTQVNAAGSAFVYSTYLAGSNNDFGQAIAVDSNGSAYVTGTTGSSDFPVTLNAYQTTPSGVFITKLKPSGSALVYSTFFGTASIIPETLTTDPTGNVYIAGSAGAGVPLMNPIQNYIPGTTGDAFVSELNATGTALPFSTYLGSASEAMGIALDSNQNIYLTGEGNVPKVIGAFNLSGTTFVSKIAVGSASAASVTASPNQLNFTAPGIGLSSAVQTAVLSNIGNVAFAIQGISASAGDFSESDTCGSSLAAGASCNVNVIFTPTALGVRMSTISISDNAPGSPQAIVTLTGQVQGPAVTLAPTSLTFTNQASGTTSAAQTVTVTNSGNTSLSLSSITATGDFAQTNTCLTHMAAGANCTISVTFTPSSSGTRVGSLTIVDDAPDSPQTVNLIGNPSGPVASVLPGTLAFENQVVGTKTGSQTVTLSNQGIATLSISSIGVAGPDAGDFAESNNCGASLNASSSCAINVTFDPTAAGNRTANLNITDNAPGSPQTAALSGTGMDFSVSSSAMSATVTAGQTATYSLAVSPLNGYNQSVSFTCSGAPAAAACAMSPTMITFSSSSAQNVSVSVTTSARSGLLPRFWLPRAPVWLPSAILALSVLFLWIFTKKNGPSARWARQLRLGGSVIGFALAVATLLIGCGGSGGGGMTGTPSGTYTITVTGTSGSLSHVVNLTLTVN